MSKKNILVHKSEKITFGRSIGLDGASVTKKVFSKENTLGAVTPVSGKVIRRTVTTHKEALRRLADR